MLWLVLSLSLIGALAILGCGNKSKEAPKADAKKPAKPARSVKSSKSARKSRKSSKSKSGKSAKSVKKSGKKGSKTSTRSLKSSKSQKSEKSAKSSESSNKIAKPQTVSKSAESVESICEAPASGTQVVELHAEPREMCFQHLGGLQTFTVFNESNERRAFKVKCSDNQLYRVAPVYGFIEPKSSTKIDVLRQNGSAKVDKIVLVTAPVSNSIKLPKEALAASSGVSQMTVIPIFVEA